MSQEQQQQSVEQRFQNTVEAVQAAWKKGYLKAGVASATFLLLVAGCISTEVKSSGIGGNQTQPPATEMTPPPSITPEPTGTPISTTTPTEVPTPTEIPKVKLSLDLENPTFILWDKVVANQMEGASTESFNDDALPYQWYLFNNRDNNVSEFGTPPMGYPDPELRPMRISGYGKTIDPDGHRILVVRVDVHNNDGSIGYWNLIYDQAKFEKLDEIIRKRLSKGVCYLKPTYRENENVKPREGNYWAEPWLYQLSKTTSPNAMKYLQEFVDTGIVNPDGNNYLWAAGYDCWTVPDDQ